ncbi:hypothetical protein EJ02DRAFT_470102 [Clathrospora elynae]|uniref:Uncharacterized protein n=1 Tax=Clathrospora elynae TaxID=706981 RepID=A0A6A5SBI4_9PLEO|nr:hypothetical protein EJ02DRAFT_470102 [Clathrospora elynae]
MARKLDSEKRRDILVNLANGKGFKTIARCHQVCRKTVKRIELSMDLYGVPYPPQSVVQGRPKLMLKYQEDSLLAFLREKPTAYLDKMSEFIFDEYGIEISERTIF